MNGANLVTIGSWSEHAQTNAFSDSSIKLINHFIALLLFSYDFFLQGNYYTDACLVAAGGKSAGKIDFYQMHTYSNGGVWNANAPFKAYSIFYQIHLTINYVSI